jgi:hypothetical protein
MTQLQLTKCYPEHLRLIEPQVEQAEDGYFVRSGGEVEYLCADHAFTAWYAARPIAAAGLLTVWPGRSEAWCMLSPAAALHMLWISRKMLFALRSLPAQRVEMHVVRTFDMGHKWARMLGFVEENGPGSGLRRNFGRNGEDFVEYVRFTGGGRIGNS